MFHYVRMSVFLKRANIKLNGLIKVLSVLLTTKSINALVINIEIIKNKNSSNMQ